MKNRICKIRIIVISLFMTIAAAGCGTENAETVGKIQTVSVETKESIQGDPYEAEEPIYANEDTITENNENEIVDEMDYSSYLKKTWIVDEWQDNDRNKDYPISIIFTRMEEKYIEGYYRIEGMVSSDYYFFLNNTHREPYQFQGIFYAGTAECKYNTGNGKSGTFSLSFCDTDRIEVQLGEDETQSYLLRPYNLSDEVFMDNQVSYEIDLDSWGIVNLFYANLEDNHSYPWVLLTNDQGDILYDFTAGYQVGSEVKEIIIEDMNGDGLKDVEVVTFFPDVPDIYRFEWYFYQEEDGSFYQGLTNMFGPD